MTRIKVLSLNVRGLRNQIKQRAIFSYLKRQKADFYCLQESYSKEGDERIWQAEWGGAIFFSHGTEHARGVCILQKPNSYFGFKCLSADPGGRFVVSKIKTRDEELFLMSIYAPNELQQQLMFIKNLGRIVNSETDISRLVITGDWNTTLHRIGKSGGCPWKPTKYRDVILDLFNGRMKPRRYL